MKHCLDSHRTGLYKCRQKTGAHYIFLHFVLHGQNSHRTGTGQDRTSVNRTKDWYRTGLPKCKPYTTYFPVFFMGRTATRQDCKGEERRAGSQGPYTGILRNSFPFSSVWAGQAHDRIAQAETDWHMMGLHKSWAWISASVSPRGGCVMREPQASHIAQPPQSARLGLRAELLQGRLICSNVLPLTSYTLPVQ
eukprot:scaffold122100_cov21-Tisochrysis_lutea.AAC.1